MDFNFIDFYILYPGHPKYTSTELIEDEVAKVIIQKYQMVIFTNKGDVYGMPNFGANLLELLHETKFSAESIENDIKAQISSYVPELATVEYTLKVSFYDHPERFEEFMVIDLSFNGYQVSAIVE
jgi:phage baseplate assembly protein W